jgi:hypothetical protein
VNEQGAPHEVYFSAHRDATWPDAFVDGRGVCWRCGRPNRALTETNAGDHAEYICGTCQSSQERAAARHRRHGRAAQP